MPITASYPCVGEGRKTKQHLLVWQGDDHCRSKRMSASGVQVHVCAALLPSAMMWSAAKQGKSDTQEQAV